MRLSLKLPLPILSPCPCPAYALSPIHLPRCRCLCPIPSCHHGRVHAHHINSWLMNRWHWSANTRSVRDPKIYTHTTIKPSIGVNCLRKIITPHVLHSCDTIF